MSALSEAIAGRPPASHLEAVSPLHGLKRGSISTIDLVAQSVAAVAPAGVLLAQTSALVSRGGSFAFFDLLLTASIVILAAMSMSIFARRISAAGGIYTFVTRGIGPSFGMLAGAAIGLGYASIAIDTLRAGVRRAVHLMLDSDPAAAPTPAATETEGILTVILVIAGGIAITVVIALGARTSTRVMLVVEVVAVSAILLVSVAVFAGTGGNIERLIPDMSSIPPLSSFAGGIGLAFVAFVGFESGAALGPESRRPLSSVPRALVWTAVAIAVVYLFGVAAQLSALPTGAEIGATSSPTLLADAEHLAAAPWIGPVIDAVIIASWIACTLACTNALVRLVFSLSREGVLPKFLGATSVRFGTPHRTALVVGAVLVGGTLLRQWAGRGSLFSEVISLSTSMGFVVAYLLVCAAATPYLVRLREFSTREAWPSMIATLALVGVIVTEVAGAEDDGNRAALFVFAALVIGLAVAHFVRCRYGPRLRARVGAYDTPVASDALPAPSERGFLP